MNIKKNYKMFLKFFIFVCIIFICVFCIFWGARSNVRKELFCQCDCKNLTSQINILCNSDIDQANECNEEILQARQQCNNDVATLNVQSHSDIGKVYNNNVEIYKNISSLQTLQEQCKNFQSVIQQENEFLKDNNGYLQDVQKALYDRLYKITICNGKLPPFI